MKTIPRLPLIGKATGSTLIIWLNLLILWQACSLKFGLLCSSPKIKWVGGNGKWERDKKWKRSALLDFAFSFLLFPQAEEDATDGLLLPYFTLHGPYRKAVWDSTAPSAGELAQLNPHHRLLLLLLQDAEYTAARESCSAREGDGKNMSFRLDNLAS